MQSRQLKLHNKIIKKRRKNNGHSKKIIKLQDVFLSQVRKDKVPVTIYLLKGIPLTGIIKRFDNYMLRIAAHAKEIGML